MRAQPAVLTIDIGLTNCKASLFATDGRPLAQAARAYPTFNPHPGWSEQDPREWWLAYKSCVEMLLADPAAYGREIIAVGVTGHMHGLVAVSREGQPLTNCWTLFDQRAGAEACELNRILGAGAAYSLTGARLEAYTPAAKILWLKRHEPEIFQETALFLSPKDMMRLELGGDIATDPIDAAGTLLYDLNKGTWATDILASLGLSRERLPEIRQSFASGGCIGKGAAAELGLKAGTPLIVGAGDDVEALGCGAVEQGQTLEHIGTTGTLITCLAAPAFDPERRLEVYPHAVPGRYLLGGATNAAGRSLDWARRFVGAEDSILPLTYPPPDGAASSPIYLPYINGERGLLWDAQASGAFLGLREAHHASDLARGVYEGVAFSLMEILSAVRDLGVEPTQVISGTPLTHRGWGLLRADVYGLPLLFPEAPDPTGLGVALLELVNQGVFANLSEAVAKCCNISQQVEPDPRGVAYYEHAFKTFRAAVQACRPLFEDLSSQVGAW
jgi:xylulokinase